MKILPVFSAGISIVSDCRAVLTEKGLLFSGTSPNWRIVEMCELTEHPFYVATQGHPELKSRPNRPHPLFRGFIAAALKDRNGNLL